MIPAASARDLVGKVAKDNTIMVTWANWHYHDFVMNWVEHLQAAGCDAFIVGKPGLSACCSFACGQKPQLCLCVCRCHGRQTA